MRKISLVLLLLVSIVGLSSCGGSSSSSGKAVFKAHINGGAGMTVVLRNADPFNPNGDTLKISESGDLVVSKAIEKPTYLTFYIPDYGNASFGVFVMPGDTLFMTTDLSDFFKKCKFSGNGAVYNNYIAQFVSRSGDFQKEIRSIFVNPEPVAMKIVDSVRAANQNTFDEFVKNNPDVDPLFVKIEQARILYEWALLHNIYPMYYRYLSKDKEYKPSPEYASYLGECNLNDADLFQLELYKMFVSTYVSMKMEDYYDNDQLQKETPSEVLYHLNLIDKTFEDSRIKELLAYEHVRDFIKQDGVKEYDDYYPTFKNMVTKESYLKDIEKSVADWLHLKKGADSYNFTYVDIDGNQVSMSDFKGKYVYIDVWATWCSPCRAEIPYLKKLEEEFSGKNIVFVSISVDQTQEPWKKMVVGEELKGVQLWAGQAPEFYEFYKIYGIPRFMLFDKEGKIYDVNAERPSGKIDEVIKALPGL